jgi:hypothetical protein
MWRLAFSTYGQLHANGVKQTRQLLEADVFPFALESIDLLSAQAGPSGELLLGHT